MIDGVDRRTEAHQNFDRDQNDMYLLSLAYTGTMWNGTGNKSKLHSKKSMKIQTSKLEKINKVRTLNTNPFSFAW